MFDARDVNVREIYMTANDHMARMKNRIGNAIVYSPKELIRYAITIVRDLDRLKMRTVEIYACRNLFSMVLTPDKHILVRKHKQTDRFDERFRQVIGEALDVPVESIKFVMSNDPTELDYCLIEDGQHAVMLALKYEL